MQSASLIDLDALPPDVRRSVEWALDDGLRRHNRDTTWAQLLADDSAATDEEIIAAAQALYPDAPITLANRYKDVDWRQELALGYPFQSPRRPVFMKGALHILIRKWGLSHHHNAGGWASLVTRRAVAMSRTTILDADEYYEFIAPILRRVSDKFPGASMVDRYIPLAIGDRPATWRDEYLQVLIGGKFSYLSRSEFQNVRALHSIIRKTEKLDATARRKLAVQHMQERMAA